MPKFKFTNAAPSGFCGYGKDTYDIPDKKLEVLKKYGNYDIEIIKEVKSSTKKSKKKSKLVL